jgi:hypothetical protein
MTIDNEYRFWYDYYKTTYYPLLINRGQDPIKLMTDKLQAIYDNLWTWQAHDDYNLKVAQFRGLVDAIVYHKGGT